MTNLISATLVYDGSGEALRNLESHKRHPNGNLVTS